LPLGWAATAHPFVGGSDAMSGPEWRGVGVVRLPQQGRG
jgi:hypothetical protein